MYVKPQRSTTEPVWLPDGINKDVSGAKLLLMTTSVYGLYSVALMLGDKMNLSPMNLSMINGYIINKV